MNECIYDEIIIGGGLSGIISAIELKRVGHCVCLLEANDRIGKKILASGNGKCNILNKSISVSNYNSKFVDNVINKYPIEKLIDYYKSIGLLLREDEGRLYPYSESANSVLNVLLEQIETLEIEVYTNNKVISILKKGTVYLVNTSECVRKARKVILATGTNASFGINSHSLIADFGHKTTKLVQTLTPIKTKAIQGANGVRSKAEATLYIEDKKILCEKGELLFKTGFLSGVLAFRLSSYISRALVKSKNINARVDIDFVPDLSEAELIEYLSTSTLANPLLGLVHKAIAENFVSCKNNINALAYKLKHYECQVEGVGPVENSQVISGGIQTEDINPCTMESLKSSGLYVLGEVLNVDGECGGYNLSFALMSALACVDSIKSE